MTVGLSATTANSLLNALGRNVSFANSAVWVQLHVGDPGAAGTANQAVETTRKQVTFAVPTGGSLTNSTEIEWATVAGSEDYTHFSAWSLDTAGTFLFSGLVTANAVSSGDTFTIPVGDLDVTFTIAA